MELPASDEREKQVMEEQEVIAPPPMFPFIGDVVLRAYLSFNTKGKKRKRFNLPMLGGKLKILRKCANCMVFSLFPIFIVISGIWTVIYHQVISFGY